MSRLSLSSAISLPLTCAILTACGGAGDATLSQSGGGTAAPVSMSASTRTAAATIVENKAVFAGPRANYTIVKTETGYTVIDNVGADGTTNLSASIARLEFTDLAFNPTIAAQAQEISTGDLKSLIELYIAFFNRVPEADGLSYWIGRFKAGANLEQISDSFYAAAIAYSSLTGYSDTMALSEFVKLIYKNVLGRSGDTAPPNEDVQYWVNRISSGLDSKGTLVKAMLASAHTFKGDPTWGWVTSLLDNKYTVGHYFAIQQGLNYSSPDISIQKTMAIAAAVTPQSTTAAIALIPVAAGSKPVDPSTNPGLQARFKNPSGLAFDPSGNLYIADTGNYTIRKMTPTGDVTTVAGAAGQRAGDDGSAVFARFSEPYALTTDSNGNIYVSDGLAVRKISSTGAVTTLAGGFELRGYVDGPGANARFDFLRGIALDDNGNLIVSDNNNHVLRKIAPDGQTSTFVGLKTEQAVTDGTPDVARFYGPQGLARGLEGSVHVMDVMSPGPQLVDGSSFLRKVTPAAVVSTVAGKVAAPPQTPATIQSGLSVTVDTAGNSYIAVPGGIKKVSPTGALSDLIANSDKIVAPGGIAINGKGELYVTTNASIVKVTQTGEVSLVAGKTGEAGSADSSP